MLKDKRIDVHCHIFNAQQHAREILVLLTIKFFNLIDGNKRKNIKALSQFNVKEKFRSLLNIVLTVKNFLSLFFKNSSREIYEEFVNYYKNCDEDIIIVPLMMDLFYAVYKPNKKKSIQLKNEEIDINFEDINQIFKEKVKDIKEEINQIKENELSKNEYEEVINNFRDDSLYINLKSMNKTDALDNIMNEFDTSVNRLTSMIEDEKNQIVTKGITQIDTGYDKQIEELEELKKDNDIKDKFYPFLAVDPRRENIINRVKDKLVDNKLFKGIKIYPPLGYLPSHPVLMEIFKICEDKGIPVTTHSSPIYITDLLNPLEIKGLMYKELINELIIENTGKAVQIDGKDFIEIDESVTLPKLNKLQLLTSLKKRSRFFADPYNWIPVLDMYPNLYLNLAHFGGDEFEDYVLFEQNGDTENKNKTWTAKIIEIIKNPKYKNVYTDISFFEDENMLNPVYKIINNDKEILNKLMYGSDFIVLMTAERKFSDYYEPFKKILKNHFDLISITNPRKFLGLNPYIRNGIKKDMIEIKVITNEKKEKKETENISERHALVIGVKDYYEDKLRNLSLTAKDANDMAEVLKNTGFFNIELLTCTEKVKPTKDNIIEAVNKYVTLTNEGKLKTFAFYFSGHGFARDEVNYLGPVDTNTEDLENSCINLDEILKIMIPIRDNAKAMLFMDSCRNDPTKKAPEMGAGIKTSWKDVDSRGLKVIYSTGIDQVSYELSSQNNGLFTGYLLEALRGNAKDKDGFVYFNDVYDYVYDKMREYSRNTKYRQYPRMDMKNILGKDFTITKI